MDIKLFATFRYAHIISLLFLACPFFSTNSYSAPQLFTLQSSTHEQTLLLDSFASSDINDLEIISSKLKQRMKDFSDQHPHQEVVLNIHIDETLRARFESESDFQNFLNSLSKTLPVTITYEKVPAHSFKKIYNKVQNALLSNYRWSFTLIRAFAIGSASTLSLRLTQDLPWDVAITSGIAAGFLTGNVQYWSKYFYSWMDSSSETGQKIGQKLFAKLQQFGLLNHDSAQEKGKNFAAWVEKFGRWYTVEAIFVSLLQIGLDMAGVSQDISATNIAWTSLLATISQGTWDFTVTTTKRLKALRGEDEKAIDYFGHLSLLGVATITTGILTVLQLMHVPYAELGFYTIGAAGAVSLYKAAKLKASEEKKNITNNSCSLNLLIPAH